MKGLIKKFIPWFLLDLYHFSLPFLGAVIYGLPSRKIKVIGVTGTNGKSTVVLMTAKILEEAGLKTASLSSIKFKIGEKEWVNPLKMTMPGRFKLQKFLRQAVNAGCKCAVLEVTSEGIKQHRHRFINFEAAVFTNLSAEHIERHGSFKKYRQEKEKLFHVCQNIHIINLDDKNAQYFLQFPAKKKFGFTTGCPVAAFGRSEVEVISSKNIGPLNLRLPGDFNIYNALAAISAGLSQGFDLEVCKKAVEKIENIPGRMEFVAKEPFKIIVDYAHTPAALEKVYKEIKGWKFKTGNSRLICVLGSAGGGRDKWKRPELGKIAAQYCDDIILTDEDPYDESPQKIISNIKQGITFFTRSLKNCYEVLDRKEAIKKALSSARPGDAVIITGKGSESWMCLAGGRKIPWSDRQAVIDGLKNLGC